MKKSNAIRGTAIAAAVGLMLTGCSGGSDDGPPELTISSWQWSEPTRGAELWSVYEGIDEANDDFTLSKIDLAYTQTLDTLSTQLGAGTGPDIVYVTEPMFYPLAEAGLLEPLDSLIPADELENLRDQNEWGNLDGSQYGYISEMASFGLIYNQDLLDEAGVEVPTTFDELTDAATAVSANTDAFGFATRNQVDETDGWYLDFKNWVVGFGGELSENGELTLNSPEAVQAAEAYKEMWDADVMPIGANVQEYRQMFIDGQLAMLLENNGNFSAALATNPELNAGVAPTPFPSGEVDATTLFVAVNAASEHKEEAAEVIRSFLQPEAQDQWVSHLGGSIGPLDVGLPEDLLAENPWMEPFQDAAATAHRMTIPDFETDTPQIQTILIEALSEVMLTDRDPQEAMDAVQEEAEQLVGD